MKMVAVRESDGLRINIGSATSYQIARQQAQFVLAHTSRWRCIHIFDSAGHRIGTVTKVRVGERELG
jgi:hypothetical protein